MTRRLRLWLREILISLDRLFVQLGEAPGHCRRMIEVRCEGAVHES